MPSRLSKHRSESTKLKHSHSRSKDAPIQIHQDQQQQQQDTGLLNNLLPSEPRLSQDSSSARPQRQPSTKQRLSDRLLHGRKQSRSSLSPASPATVNSTSMSLTTSKVASAASAPIIAEPLTEQGGGGGTAMPASSRGQAPTPAPAPAPVAQPQRDPHEPQRIPTRMNSTIRTVPSFDERDGASTSENSSFAERDNLSNPPSQTATPRSSAFSSSTNSNDPKEEISRGMSQHNQQDGAVERSNSKKKRDVAVSIGAGEVAQALRSPRIGGLSPQPPTVNDPSRLSFEVPVRDSSRGAATSTVTTTLSPNPVHQFEPSYPRAVTSSPPVNDNEPQSFDGTEGFGIQASAYDSAIGKASIGKTGRVMNRLIADNDSLKRDLKFEKMRSDDMQKQMRLNDEKVAKIKEEYESKLTEANINKSLLARKERRVETLEANIETEKAKAAAAMESERRWKEQLDTVLADSQRKVEEANMRVMMVESQYSAISSHWPSEKALVEKNMVKMRKEIQDYAKTRAEDEEAKRRLGELCDQYASIIRAKEVENQELKAKLEEYKVFKLDYLKETLALAEDAEVKTEKVLKEGKETLDELKWALNVKKTIPWAG